MNRRVLTILSSVTVNVHRLILDGRKKADAVYLVGTNFLPIPLANNKFGVPKSVLFLFPVGSEFEFVRDMLQFGDINREGTS